MDALHEWEGGKGAGRRREREKERKREVGIHQYNVSLELCNLDSFLSRSGAHFLLHMTYLPPCL